METAPTEDGLNDVVKLINWRRNAVDGEYRADIYGQMVCAPPNPQDFTSYPYLTQSQVEGWLNQGLDVPQLDLSLDAQIEYQKNPPIVQLPLPWNNQN